jgi:uncharacterized membrane protein YkvA (DUF1232 family)
MPRVHTRGSTRIAISWGGHERVAREARTAAVHCPPTATKYNARFEMLSKIRSAKRLFVDLPRMLRLAYCLMFDARVPRYMKLAFGGGLALIALPVVDLPESLPVIGELDVLALSLLATRAFIAACPRAVVAEQEQLITLRRSRFDDDVRNGERIAMMIYRRLRPEEREAVS